MKNYLQDFFEFWRKVWCPKCNTANWLYDSHSQRAYPYIPNGCKCYQCQNRFFVGDEEEFKARYYTELEEHNIEEVINEYLDCEEGKEKPS